MAAPAKNTFLCALYCGVGGGGVQKYCFARAPRGHKPREQIGLRFDIEDALARPSAALCSLSSLSFHIDILLKVAPVRAQLARARAAPETC